MQVLVVVFISCIPGRIWVVFFIFECDKNQKIGPALTTQHCCTDLFGRMFIIAFSSSVESI